MSDEAWNTSFVRALMVRLSGDALEETDDEGRRLFDDTFLVLLNAAHTGVTFHLPPAGEGFAWERLLDTAAAAWGRTVPLRGARYRARGRAFVLLRARSAAAERDDPRPPPRRRP
jgi:glycogen operon protein